MERNPALQAAEEAVAWAMAPCPDGSHRNNYALLLETVCRTASSSDAPNLPGLCMAYWPCLSRMLVMDEPALAESVRPRYVEALDCQAGIAWMQLQFAAVTGRRPAVRSWRHAPRRGCASL